MSKNIPSRVKTKSCPVSHRVLHRAARCPWLRGLCRNRFLEEATEPRPRQAQGTAWITARHGLQDPGVVSNSGKRLGDQPRALSFRLGGRKEGPSSRSADGFLPPAGTHPFANRKRFKCLWKCPETVKSTITLAEMASGSPSDE